MRVICQMVVGPGEADRYLDQVLTRAQLWADLIFCGIDQKATDAEVDIIKYRATHWTRLPIAWEQHEGKFRTAAWQVMEEAVKPSPEDFIVALDADEVIHDHYMVQKVAYEYPKQRFAFTFHEMFSPTAYRIDGHWKPYQAAIMFPYKHGANFRDRPIACGREPTYVDALPPPGLPISDLLHYGYARQSDRDHKLERYMRLDGGKYHNLHHLLSIAHVPDLREWTKGGLLDV